MLTVILIMSFGVLLGFVLKKQKKLFKISDKGVSLTIYLLLFFLGLSVGQNRMIVNNLSTIGLQALVITLGALGGGFIVMKLFEKYFMDNKKDKNVSEGGKNER